jgi:hypothetical protein
LFTTKTIKIKGAKRNKAKIIAMLKHPGKNYRWSRDRSFCLSIDDKNNYKRELTNDR